MVAGEPPKRYLASDGSWPSGPFRPNAPAGVLVAAEVCSTLVTAIGRSGESTTSVASGLGLTPSELEDILQGESLPQMRVIARAELYLNVSLFPIFLRPRSHPGYGDR